MGYSTNFQVETCIKWSDSPSQQIDLAFNIFFLIYFFIRVSVFSICFTSYSLHNFQFFSIKITIIYNTLTSQRKFQFIAASDKVWFLLEVYSFVDYFTIPPSFVAIYLERNWLGKCRKQALFCEHIYLLLKSKLLTKFIDIIFNNRKMFKIKVNF